VNEGFIDSMSSVAVPIVLHDGPGVVVPSGIDLGGRRPTMQVGIVSDRIFNTVLECCDRATSTPTRLFLPIEYNCPLSLSVSADRL
jgi:hypothetical protein